MSEKNSVVAIFESHNQAEAAVGELQKSGFDMTKLSIVGRDYHTEEHVVGYYNTGDRMKHWENWGRSGVTAVDLRGDCCLVFGAEGPGLTAAVLAACDDMVEIPMPSHMNSLNVAVATGIFLYEATRHAVTSKL